MNRIWLSARSLVSSSWLVRIALLIFFLVAAWFISCDISAPMMMFFASILAGIGYTCRRYLRSERRQLVPGMNETCAALAISLWAILCVISIALLIGMHGFFPECIGCILLVLAFSLWVGMLERIALSLLILFYTCLLYTSPSPRDLSTSRMPSSA